VVCGDALVAAQTANRMPSVLRVHLRATPRFSRGRRESPNSPNTFARLS
jgi:hypothetical protein